MATQRFSYYLGLGSNIGNRSGNLNKCLQHLNNVGTIQKTSFLYESQPMYYQQQSPFLNAAVHIESTLNPIDLLPQLKHIESNVMNREEGFKNGPRNIDIDILCAFDENSKEIYFQNDTNTKYPIQVPHARIAERNFVLTPLADILPDYKLPTVNETVSQLSQSPSE